MYSKGANSPYSAYGVSLTQKTPVGSFSALYTPTAGTNVGGLNDIHNSSTAVGAEPTQTRGTPESGYELGFRGDLGVKGLTAMAFYNKQDRMDSVTTKNDMKGQRYAATYVTGPFSIAADYAKVDGVPTGQSATLALAGEDIKSKSIGLGYAITPNLSASITRGTSEISNPNTVTGRTVAKEEKDYYVVNGSKIWITNSPIADVFVIWCKDESNKIIGLVTERNDSIKTPEIKDKMALLASPTGYIYLDNVKIPKSNRLNVHGLKGPFHCLNKARYGISWGVVGAMENIIDTAINYTNERKQFDKSLNQFQLIQNDLINSIQIYNNSLNNSFGSLNAIKSFDELERNVALISFLKKVNCENALNVSRVCRDMLGGNGVSNSYNIIRHLINLEAVNTYEGTKNIHNLILGRDLLGKNAFI